MFKKDYLQRQFEEFGRALAKLLQYKNEKDFVAYEKAYVSSFQNFVSLKAEEVEQLSVDEFKSKFTNQTILSSEQLNWMADLLYEKLNFYLEFKEEQKVKNLRDKCLLLYSEINENALESEFNLGIHYRLKFLKEL